MDMLKKILFFLLCIGFGGKVFDVSNGSSLIAKQVVPATPYQRSPHVSEKVWDKVQPYLLPLNHPVKPELDRIFSEYRATSSHSAMTNAGFSFKLPRGDRRVTVAKHREIKGHLLKTYLDTQNVKQKEWKIWIHRIKGAKCIQASIERHRYKHIMKTPKKWIYPLPPTPLEGEGHFRQNFVLVVENMRILSTEKNKNKYYKALNKEKLDALYVLITENLLIDSVYIDNIPFCKDGKIAFIDTEHYLTKERPLKLHRMAKHFSPTMQDYWKKVLENGGPLDHK